MQHRVSQRQPLACRECTQRKRKCDKQIPCSRCQRLKLHCTREVVQLRRHIKRHGSEIDFLKSIKQDAEVSNGDLRHHILSKLNERIRSLEHDLLSSDTSPVLSQSGGQSAPNVYPADFPPASQTLVPDDISLVTAIEHLAWGRNYGNCYPHRNCACQNHRSRSESSQAFDFTNSDLAAAINLPSLEDAKRLVSFHMRQIAWHHNCIHQPTFWDQCQLFWKTGRCPQPQWLALYCSVLSTAIFCLQNSPKFEVEFFTTLGTQDAHDLFTSMVNILYSSQFLQELSLYSVQAIVISTEIAHNIGYSQLNATLFNAAIRVAECLGLHKIEDNTSTSYPAAEKWDERIEKEVGKRVWCQMVVQDHFAIPFTDSNGINPAQYSTTLPMNADDHDLVGMPDTEPTISTYNRVLANVAELMPELAAGLGPLRNRKPVNEQYMHILQMDQKMRQLVNQIPNFLLRQDLEQEARLPWLGIARQSLAITAAEKIIMIHRPFIFRSFQSDLYVHTRRTCVSAALTILREHESIVQAQELSLWTHTAFCITAAVILCFEIKSSSSSPKNNGSSITIDDYKNRVQAARHRLAARKGDVLARRGMMLISAILPEINDTSLLSEQQRLHSTNSLQGKIDFREVVARFAAEMAPTLGPNTYLTQSSPFDDTQDLELLEERDRLAQNFESNLLPGDDFEAWFRDVFVTTNTIHGQALS